MNDVTVLDALHDMIELASMWEKGRLVGDSLTLQRRNNTTEIMRQAERRRLLRRARLVAKLVADEQENERGLSLSLPGHIVFDQAEAIARFIEAYSGKPRTPGLSPRLFLDHYFASQADAQPLSDAVIAVWNYVSDCLREAGALGRSRVIDSPRWPQ
jgi:hypothetical protein